MTHLMLGIDIQTIKTELNFSSNAEQVYQYYTMYDLVPRTTFELLKNSSDIFEDEPIDLHTISQILYILLLIFLLIL